MECDVCGHYSDDAPMFKVIQNGREKLICP